MKPATVRGAFSCLIRNIVRQRNSLSLMKSHDVPRQALEVYGKRWSIEVFFRMDKQELGFEHCHSTSEMHQHAHLELVFATETLLAYALWQVNKEKTSNESCTTAKWFADSSKLVARYEQETKKASNESTLSLTQR